MATCMIYRIEGAEGIGPYRVKPDVVWGLDSPTESRHPTPCQDADLCHVWEVLNDDEDNQLFSFGFESEEQMLDWFYADDWLYAMRKSGLKLTIWEADWAYVHFGSSQAIFRKDKAVQVCSRELCSDERYLRWLEQE